MDIFGPVAGAIAGKAIDIWSGRQAAEDERHFTEYMSNTSYQRAVKDMRAAGLNPMLAYQQGGASTPSTSQADTGSFSSSLSSAVQASRMKAEVELLKQQARKTSAEATIVEKEEPKAEVIEDIWRGVAGVYSSAKDVGKYAADMAKTYPLVPRAKPYRQALQPLTERQREQLRRTGSYTRPARQR